MASGIDGAGRQCDGPDNRPTQEDLPPLTDHEFKIYNRLAERMDQFHNYFRQSWHTIHTAALTSRRPSNMTLKQFLSEAASFADHLSAHHSIEETYVFPILATKMPEFNPKRGPLVQQHAQIHDGLEAFEAYVKRCAKGEEDFEMAVLRDKMDGWGEVLMRHLDEEVRFLEADNMRRHWSKEEMMRLPM